MTTTLERLAELDKIMENNDATEDEIEEYFILWPQLIGHLIDIAQTVVNNVTRDTASASIWDRWEADGWSEMIAPLVEPYD
jgi:hypothetical protein